MVRIIFPSQSWIAPWCSASIRWFPFLHIPPLSIVFYTILFPDLPQFYYDSVFEFTEFSLFDYDENTEFTDDDFEGDGYDEIDDEITDSDIDENSGEYHTDDQSRVGAANMDDE